MACALPVAEIKVSLSAPKSQRFLRFAIAMPIADPRNLPSLSYVMVGVPPSEIRRNGPCCKRSLSLKAAMLASLTHSLTRQDKAMLHCDLRVRWKVASDFAISGCDF